MKTPEVSAALDEAHAVALAGQIDDGNTAFVFRNEADLHAWARSAPSPIAEELDKVKELARKAKELESSDHARAMFWQELVTNTVVSQMHSLAERLGLDPASPELLNLAHEGTSVLEPPVLRSTILWNGPQCASGSFCPMLTGVPLPVLSWVGFDNRASSLTGFLATVTLWENNWFAGPSAFFFALGACIHLDNVGFSNIASSGLTV